MKTLLTVNDKQSGLKAHEYGFSPYAELTRGGANFWNRPNWALQIGRDWEAPLHIHDVEGHH